MPPTGTQTLVKTVFDQWHDTNAPKMEADDAWEIFTSWLLLRGYNLTLDDIHSGVVGGSDDAGIDGVFTLLEGASLEVDSDIVEKPSTAREFQEGLELELHVIQAKNRDSFGQLEVTKLQSVLPAALDLSRDINDLALEMREEVRDRLDIFRRAVRNLLVRRPKIVVKVWMVSRGISESIADNVSTRAERLREDLANLLPNAAVSVNFAGANELWKIYDSRSPETLELHCDEILTSGESYVALAPLSNYVSLICESDFSVRRHLFDANVRDYQRQVAVNKEIATTLNDPASPEFWWMNNGVTILCDDAHSVGKRIALRNIQIVNGLQTSHTIADWFKENGTSKSSKPTDAAEALGQRRILVRIIVADDDTVRDRIIRATNRQTPVEDASLRATDRIQRQIEKYFESKGIFYDRRKGYYRNLGKDPSKIMSIAYLGQAMYAVAYGRPEVARGKPNSLLAEEARYRQAFDPSAGIDVFYWVARVLRTVDAHLQSATSQMRYPERRYLSPFVAYAVVVRALKESPQHWTTLLPTIRDGKEFSDAEIEEAAAIVKQTLDKFTADHGTSAADATKRQPFTQALTEALLVTA